VVGGAEMTEQRFVRVSDRLYEEHLAGTSSPVKWVKRPERLYLELFDVVAVNGAEFSFKFLDSGDITVDPSELRSIKEIRAKGKIKNEDGIGFIDSKGTTSTVSAKTDVKEVQLLGVADEELVSEGRSGSLVHMTEDSDLLLALLVPKSVFDEAWTEIRTGVAKRVELSTHVEVFQTELERSLGDPRMPQVYYIENGSANAATFSGLRVSSAPLNSLPAELQDRGEKPSVLINNIAVMNQIALSMRIIAAGVVVIAFLLLIRLF